MAHLISPYVSTLSDDPTPKTQSFTTVNKDATRITETFTVLDDDLIQETQPPPSAPSVELSPLAQLVTINIGRLYQGNEEEANTLFKAAKDDGFFYLDLQNSAFEGMIDTVDDVFALSKDLFSLDEEDKMGYDVDKLGKLKLNG